MVFITCTAETTVAAEEHCTVAGLFSVGSGEDVVEFGWSPRRRYADAVEFFGGDFGVR